MKSEELFSEFPSVTKKEWEKAIEKELSALRTANSPLWGAGGLNIFLIMRNPLLIILIAFSISSCKVLTPSIMLRTPNNFNYSNFPDSISLQYKISKSDLVQLRLFTNDGFRLMDVSGEGGNTVMLAQSSGFQYLVEFDGTANFPILGRVSIAGLTIRETELMLQDRYAEYFHNPFIMLNVQNRRVFMFPGTDGAARVVTLQYDNTTLIEALAMSGGITQLGKAHKIKLIRGNPYKPEVYLIDLSKIEGIKQGSMVLQANDIIYVEPRYKIASRVLSEITPYLSIFSTAILVYTIATGLNK